MSLNIWRRGERMSSGVRGSVMETSGGVAEVSSGSSPKMASNSVRKVANTGAGMLRVGENTIPTLRTDILLMSELLMMPIRKAERARRRAQLALGSLCTRRLYAAIFFCLSSSSKRKDVSMAFGCPRTNVAYLVLQGT